MTAPDRRARGASLPKPIICPLPRVDGTDPQVSIDGPTSFVLAYPGYARLPALIPVFSVGTGRVARRDPGGKLAVQVAHGKGQVSRYSGLAFAMVPHEQPRCGRRIAAGDLLGYVRREHARVRVELLQQDLEPRDVTDEIAGWAILPWFAEASALGAPTSPRHPRAPERTIQPRAGRDPDVGAR